MNLDNYLLFMSNSAGANANASSSSSWASILMLVAMFAILYFLMIRPQKKQEKADAQMRESLQIGDEVITVGGIMGRIVTVKEDSIVIETGADKTKLRITRTSIYTNVTASEKVAANRQAALEAAKAKKEASKSSKKSDKSSKDTKDAKDTTDSKADKASEEKEENKD